ncbi:GNAT family N-acetyltransferase [Paenibacillus sp. 1001270B_150601_E10]|uniref:GNAT family N-acetyltransferase n=1 Tax=Paenibacillus sp. 1001270B_150601_E10 TaxID=2787079 RepID=UPI00189E43F6|nr:GNAT family N-acetyltransferase [Paenibacillus sp. 1001270B_150601_E10]
MHSKQNLVLVQDYKDDKVYRDRFNQLTSLVFDINFEDWYQKGCWDDRYICYSFLKDHEIVANVSISKMDVRIHRENKKAIQIGTVATHPDYRGMGLSRALMEHVLHLYEQECDLFFLFANRSALDFYPKFGFEPVHEWQFELKRDPIPNRDSILRKLDCSSEEDLQFIKRMVLSRKPISEQFGVSNNQGLFMFYALHAFPDSIYYSQEDDAIVVYQQEGHTLHLYDVVSQGDINMQCLLKRIANKETESIHFHFTPDPCMEIAQCEPWDNDDDRLFIKANFDLDKKAMFRVPLLAHA